MAFRRNLLGEALPGSDILTSAMVGIGMLFAADGLSNPNIEDTLMGASIEGMGKDDLRVLAVLMTWLEVHSRWINADRLTYLVVAHPEARVKAFWSAVGRWLSKDRRFARLVQGHQGAAVDLLATGTDFHLRRAGEDPRFAGSALRVPAGVLRDRKGDVLSPAELARRHGAYRRRILLGPSYRADMWAELDRDPGLSAAELARRTYGSFATAWQVKQDWALLDGAKAH
jgi:hypothetical protein